MNYFPAIGLEIHIELNTKSKMFCSCKNDPFEKEPNKNICPICTGHPGTLPQINKEAVKKVIKAGISLDCEISKFSWFERKNYFYPDLPKGYQISQYQLPLCKNGSLKLKKRKIRIRRIHLEEDTARLIHLKDYTLVDFNRAGIPLMELVTEPDIISPQEAKDFAQQLRLLLNYLEISEADMEKGQMRIEANVSLSKSLKKKNLGTKVEIKNLNSFKALEKAIEYEIKRQKELLKKGKKILQETRGWDSTKEITLSQREKETAPDYRYFPEPDLPPLEISEKMIKEIKAQIPELPWQKKERFKQEYYLSDKESQILVENKPLGDYFEKTISELRNWIKEANLKEKVSEEEFKKLVSFAKNYLIVELKGLLEKEKIKIEKSEFKILPENFAEFIKMLWQGEISSKIAKMLLREMFFTGADPSQIVEEKELKLLQNQELLLEIVQKVLKENPKAVLDFKAGKEKALEFLLGKVMAKTKGKAQPQKARELLTRLLKELK